MSHWGLYIRASQRVARRSSCEWRAARQAAKKKSNNNCLVPYSFSGNNVARICIEKLIFINFSNFVKKSLCKKSQASILSFSALKQWKLI